MFGRGHFNRLRYNPPEISNDYALHELISASVEAAPTIGEDISFSGDPATAFHGRGGGLSFAVAVHAHGAETIQSGIDAGIMHYIIHALSASLSARSTGTMNCRVSGKIAAALMQKSDERGNVSVHEIMGAKIRNGAKVGANYQMKRTEAYEITGAMTGTARFETDYININIPIPPKGKLVIDTEHYTVTLNGENVLYAHDGSWAKIDRRTKKIKIVLPTRPASWGATVEYRERFL